MKVTYVESNKTWVISHIRPSEDRIANKLEDTLSKQNKKVVVLPADFEVASKQIWFCDWLFKNGPIRYKTSKPDDEPITEGKGKIAKFISKLDYYEQINLHIALLMADDPKLLTEEAYEFAVMHFDNQNHEGLRYYLDKAMHTTTYK